MKKLSLISVAALMLASCSSDEMSAPAGAGTEQEVSLSFQLPSEVMARATQSGTNSAKGGATNCTGDVTFTVQISYGDNEVFSESATASIPNANASVTFRPTLVLGETYKIVAYAQFDGEVTDLTQITEDGSINDETVDSYFHSGDIVAAPQMSAVLYRPTGKLRILADDFAATEKQLGKTITGIKVTYEDNQETVFNATTGEWASATEANNETTELAIPTYNNETKKESKTLMVDYIPAPKDGTSKIIKLNKVEVTFNDGSKYVKDLSTLDVPIKRNYLTTLKGNFFTQEMELTLQIDDAFETPEEVVNYEFAAAFANGGVVTLSEDVTLDALYTVAEGKTVVINLNGKSITSAPEGDIAFSIPATSSLVINGEGSVSTEKTLLYATYGTLQINGGNHTAGVEVAEANGKNGEGVVEINGGHFEVEPYNGNYWTLNKKDNTGATIVVKGGSFVGFDPADNVSENPTENFVAEGYKSTAIGDVYYVTKASETPIAAGVIQVADNEYAVSSAEGMSWFADQVNTNGNANMTITLTNDIDLENVEWTPIGQTGGYGVATYFKGVFDGNGHTIKNLEITTTNAGKNYAAGLFGFIDAADATIKNLTVDGAVVNGHHWTGVIVGYLTGAIENCHVKNATVVCTHANADACGDKAGTITGYINSGSVKNCTAENSTVKAGRDGGQIVGASKPAYVSGCSATNVVVSATGDCEDDDAGKNIRNEVIGREL